MLDERSGSWISVDDRRGSIRELAIVFGLTVGLWLLPWILRGGGISFEFGQTRLLATLLAEIICVIVLWPWLAYRGWSFGAIAGAPQPIDILRGLGKSPWSHTWLITSAPTPGSCLYQGLTTYSCTRMP